MKGNTFYCLLCFSEVCGKQNTLCRLIRIGHILIPHWFDFQYLDKYMSNITSITVYHVNFEVKFVIKQSR